jgi:hypothetical protein
MQATTRARSWFWSGEEPEWIVVVTVIVAIGLGWALTAGLSLQTTGLSLDGLSLRYPSGWIRDDVAAAEEGYALGVQGLEASRPRVAVGILVDLDPAAPVSLDELVAIHGFAQAANRELYRVLSSELVKVGNTSGVAVTYGYVEDSGGSPHLSDLPAVIEGVDYLVPHEGKVYVISMEAAATDFAKQQRAFDRILRSVRFR